MEETRDMLPYKEVPYFQMFRETCAMLEKLPDEAFIPVVRAGFAFFLRSEIVEIADPITQAVYECFRMNIQRSIDAYNQSRLNGSIGGQKSHPRNNKYTKVPLSPLKGTQPTEQNISDQNKPKRNISDHISIKRKNIPLSIDEVWEYAQILNSEKGFSMNYADCEAFIDHHSARGWILNNGKPVKDWQSAFRTWARNAQKWGHQASESGTKSYGGSLYDE